MMHSIVPFHEDAGGLPVDGAIEHRTFDRADATVSAEDAIELVNLLLAAFQAEKLVQAQVTLERALYDSVLLVVLAEIEVAG